MSAVFTKISFALALSINPSSVTSTEMTNKHHLEQHISDPFVFPPFRLMPRPANFATRLAACSPSSRTTRPSTTRSAASDINPANNITVTIPPVHAQYVLSSSTPLLLIPIPHSTRPFLLPLLHILSPKFHVELIPRHPTQPWIHHTLTFVNITYIRRPRHHPRLSHCCRAQLRLCVCDRYRGTGTGAGASATVAHAALPSCRLIEVNIFMVRWNLDTPSAVDNLDS
ncbi:hypothetical protein B0H11DRAFT_2232710 [Mycena galericulata]|nr:hypothetical protein B0H11DRAFT_2232710 [Mycena galericulata]